MAPYDHEPPERGSGGPRCPICKQPTVAVHKPKPFCSKRCADIDLHRWLSGVYAVPTNEAPDGEDESEK